MPRAPRSRPFPSARAARVRLLLVDVDGTLTDGGLYYFDDGGSAVRFHVRDGLGLREARRAGLLVGVVSGRDTPQVRARAEELQLDEIHLGVADKAAVLREIQARRRVTPAETCYVGDDVVDAPAMELSGLPVAVADAPAAVRARAAWVTPAPGGHGAVRELVDRLLAARRGAKKKRR